MAIATYFQEAIDLVAPHKHLSFVVDGTYAPLEWSYSGLEVRGGSDLACGIGAAALLDDMGFRFYAPQPRFWKLPAEVPEDRVQARGTNWIPSARTFLVYGHSWAGTNAASRDFLNDAYARWASLNSVDLAGYPAGHRWKNVIDSNPSFFAAHPQLLRPLGLAQTFALDQISGTSDWALLAEFCAAFLLAEGLNEFSRTHFDPVDGDDNASDLVYPFCLDVVTRMRAGTGAIGGLPAQAGAPGAQIGVYAYAGHRLPPLAPYKPGVYTQVALAFNATGLTYLDLIQQHGALADAIAIREYMDTQVWTDGKPCLNARNKRGYLDRYDDFQAAGVREVNSEFTANWLVNMVLGRAHVLKFRTGKADFAAIIDELVADIFDGDPAVADLYTLWTDPVERYHKWSLRRAFELVANMAEGWYKEEFRQLMTIYYQYHRCDNAAEYGIVRAPGQPSDTFEAEISKLLSWVTALRDSDTLHSYALVRQEANAALDDYPHLKFNAVPEPAWFATPVVPQLADFDAAFAAIVAETYRDAALDGSDLVLRLVVPTASPETSVMVSHLPAMAYKSDDGVSVYLVVGPSKVTVTETLSGEVSHMTFGPGLHGFDLPGGQTVTWDGGLVFMDTFPFVRKDPDGTGRCHWLYVPETVAGAVDLEASSRWSFYDEASARKDWMPGSFYPDLGPGQVAVDNINTRGQVSNGNCNRYLSPRADVALMTRTMARRAGPVSTIRIVAEPPD